MPPIRRYLRISQHSVLECRIFLENPADGPRWLLNQSDPALPRVFEAVYPLVLPKLREEHERQKGKGKKKKSVKDVVARDDFEVSVFLTDVSTRHAVMVKAKSFADVDRTRQRTEEPILMQEDSDEVDLSEIPQAGDNDDFEVVESRSMSNQGVFADDKKKLAFRTTFNGFAIWGKVLCLLVERKGPAGRKTASTGNSQAIMQEWMTATQQQREADEE